MKTEYLWREFYQSAITETDHGKLPNRLQAAKTAIDSRLHELQLDHGGTPEERLAISDALAGLLILRKELDTSSLPKRALAGINGRRNQWEYGDRLVRAGNLPSHFGRLQSSPLLRFRCP